MSHNRYNIIDQETQIVPNNAKMLYLSTAKYDGDWHCVPHTHTFAELFYVVNGMGQFRIESNYYSVSAGDLIILNPNVEHTETSLDSQPLEYIVLGVKDLELSVKEGEDTRFCIAHFQMKQADILSHLRTMQREIEAELPGYEIICRNLLDILIIRLMRQTNFSATLTPTPKHASHTCSVARRYIDTHYKDDLTLEALAKIAHVSKYYLAHAFSKEYGVSPMSYLTMRRIEESRDLLATTNFPLTQIACFLGFSSGSYFSQSFRKQEGMSPMEYRRMHRTDKTNR